MKIVFWNLNDTDLSDEILALVLDELPEVLVLAEFESTITTLHQKLQNSGMTYHLVPTIACERIRILTTYGQNKFSIGPDSARYCIHELKRSGTKPVLLCSVHLPSKLHSDDLGQLDSASLLKEDIERAEELAGHRNTVVIGDFNMNPFDPGLVSASGLNAVSSQGVAAKVKRSIREKERYFFYNPSWRLLTETGDIAGTYYHKSPSTLSLYWNALDQVLIRPSLIDNFVPNSLKVITEISGYRLADSEGRPQTSDHFPIAFEITD